MYRFIVILSLFTVTALVVASAVDLPGGRLEERPAHPGGPVASTDGCIDDDGDGVCLPQDCDDTNPDCTLDCTDTDVDADGDTDIAAIEMTTSPAWPDASDGLVWFDNLDGHGNFGPKNAIYRGYSPYVHINFAAADLDGDTCVNDLDCDAANADVWTAPAAGRELWLYRDATTVTLSWLPPEIPGATAVRYDTLRSTSAADFTGPAACMESDGTETEMDDPGDPPVGGSYFYLIRSENDCPGDPGSLGHDSGGMPRSGLGCP